MRFGRPDSFMVFLSVAGILSGTGGLITGESSQVIAEVLPSWLLFWNWSLLLGGIVGLVSVASKWPLNRLLERVAAGFLGCLMLVYGVAICVVDTAFFSTAAGVILAAGCAALWRVRTATLELREWRMWLREFTKRSE